MMETFTQGLSMSAGPWLTALGVLGLKSAGLLLFVVVALRLLPGLSAADRHLIWAVAASATLAIPVLGGVLPNLGIPLPASESRTVAAPIGATEAIGVPSAPLTALGSAGTQVASARAQVIPHQGTAAVAQPRSAAATTGATASRPASHGITLSSWAPAAGLMLWTAVAGALLLSLVVGWARLRALERRAPSASGTRLERVARDVAARVGLRRAPRVLIGGPHTVPMTWGVLRSRLLLPAGAEDWAAHRLEGVLAHELAHARRRDYLAQLVVHVARAVQWFNPMLWVAARRMRLEREFACDEFVVATGLTDGPSYASDLVAIARAYNRGTPVHASALAMARPGHLRSRLIAVLDVTRAPQPLARPRAWVSSATIVVLVATLSAMAPARPDLETPTATRQALPPEDGTRSGTIDRFAAVATPLSVRQAVPSEREAVPPVQEAAILCNTGDGQERRSMHMTKDGRITIDHEYGDCRSTVEIDGDIEFSDDFTAIRRVPRDGRLRIEVRRGDTDMRLEVRAGADGTPDHSWRVDGDDRAYDEDARTWFARALLEVFRTSSYLATERAEWILRERGVDGVFAEIDHLRSDHVKRRYYEALLDSGGLESTDIRRVLLQASEDVESDHNLSQILMTTAERYPLDSTTRTAFIDASRSLDSDHQQGKVFEQALKWPDLDGQHISALLEAAADDIESDHTLSGILLALVERFPMDPEVRDPYLRAAATLESDHRKGAVYEALLENEALSDAEISEVLRAARTIGSDNRLSRLLQRLAEQGLPRPAMRTAFLETARSIGSDSNLRATLEAFMVADGVDEQSLIDMLNASREIGSDSQLARLLVSFAERHRVEGEVERAFMSALEAISSDSQARRVHRALDGGLR